MGTTPVPDGDYYFNVRTRMVEHGKLSAWEHLMGPYDTHEEAELALEIAAARTSDWDAKDADWQEADADWDEEDSHPDTP